MKTIHKQPIPSINSRVVLRLSTDAKFIHFDLQNRDMCVWVETPVIVKEYKTRTLAVFGTGFDVPDEAVHIGTLQDRGYVWHLYELPNKGDAA